MLSTRMKKNTINLLDNFETQIENILPQYNIFSDTNDYEKNIRIKTSEIIAKLADIEQVSFEHAVIAVCALLQSGAYLKSVLNRKVHINGVQFSKKNLVFAAEQVNNVYTLRSIAKSLKQITARIAVEYQIPGHLYSQFKLEVRHIYSI